jgi:hypothetical protein
VQTQRTPTGKERSTVWAGPEGKSATRQEVITNDREAGTRTGEVTATGPNGQPRTTTDITTRADDGYTRETVTTNPNGSTMSRSVTGSYDADTQTWSKTVERERTPAPTETE